MPTDTIAGGDAGAGGAPGDDPAPAREEMQAAPPFLSWAAIYGIVLGALALQVAIYAALTAVYR